eukprot:CAMPEP_0168557798 /NCGR_PEP_ID=MMETSP0413-20121227/9623_1 /TAXON_ID=136452 /ORGANISM="Filamoeba nolandi, Strain NC-AS-23-1" /LENGTH=175 /DNA_ID=CAMNT_0008588865 /DNA_START=74 /DNA_END=598 /DNA_ORIENTATION=-
MSSNFDLESVLEKDFANALEKFGIENKYIQNFRTREPEQKGWDFGTVEPSILEVQQKEADYFMKCIELEEQMEVENVDPIVKKQMKDDVKLYRAELEALKWERINKIEEMEQMKKHQLTSLGISGVVLSVTEEELLVLNTPAEETTTSSPSTTEHAERPDSLNTNEQTTEVQQDA